MNDLISRQAALDAVKNAIISAEQSYAEDALRELPSVEPERIAKVKVRYCVGYCECGQAVNTYSTYCHKCGAKLDWSGDEF